LKGINHRKHLREWNNDPIKMGFHITPHNMLVNVETMERVENEELLENIRNSTLVITVGKDTVVDNKKTLQAFERLGTDDKQIISYEDVDHSINQDGEYIPLIVKDITDWMKIRVNTNH
jgi:esterase/lipase